MALNGGCVGHEPNFCSNECTIQSKWEFNSNDALAVSPWFTRSLLKKDGTLRKKVGIIVRRLLVSITTVNAQLKSQ